jgi:predicted O-methyltransferase YrrM
MTRAELRLPFDRGLTDFGPGRPFWAHGSFQHLLEDVPRLRHAFTELPNDAGANAYPGEPHADQVPSAYRDHGYGTLFYRLARAMRPAIAVELGVLHGYSLICIAAGLRDNKAGIIEGFDLFEHYPYHHARERDVNEHVRACGLSDWARIHQANALDVAGRYDNVDYLHVDISNDGETFDRIFTQWGAKVRQVILLEGGSANRDQVHWMARHAKKPIQPAVSRIRESAGDWLVHVLEPFPSVTVLVRKSWADSASK